MEKKNEKTLQARVDQVLGSIFPTFRDVKIVHEKSFSIKFGHHNVTVNLKEPPEGTSRAIFDILLTIEGKNLILLELKREGLSLTEEDAKQGLSYAKLLQPMAPLTIVTNGEENRFYNTYTGEKIQVEEDLDMEYLQKLMDNATKLATNDFKEAVNLLLNKEPELFSQVINQISEERFLRHIGGVSEFDKPISDAFLLPRDLADDISACFAEGAPLVGVIGHAYSGKTNLLYQFFNQTQSQQDFLLYVDCLDNNYSILQNLADQFSMSAKVSITKEKIREWLICSLSNMPESKFYLLVDNFNDEVAESVKEDIMNLINLFDGEAHHTLYTIDEENFKRIAFFKNRNHKTLIGKKSKILKLDELNDNEYKKTNAYMAELHRLYVARGGHFTPEYREPRILRYLVGLLSGKAPEDKITRVIAVPDFELLKTITQNRITTRQIHGLYQKIVECFFAEGAKRKANAHLMTATIGTGAITRETFREKFPDDIGALIDTSTVVLREIRNEQVIIVPKQQELIAWYSIEPLKQLLLEAEEQGKAISEKAALFVEWLTILPYSDIVGVGVFLKLAEESPTLFSDLLHEFLEMAPELEYIGKGSQVLIYSEGVGHVQIDFEDGMEDGGVLSDPMPYAVLSQLVGYPMGIEGIDGDALYDFHLYMIYTLGSSPHFLRRADSRSLVNMKHFDALEIKGVGTLLSGSQGILEPLVQSIQKCLFIIPKEIQRLIEAAFENSNLNLAHRIFLAIGEYDDYLEPEIADIVKDFLPRYRTLFDSVMSEIINAPNYQPDEEVEYKLTLKDSDKIRS